MLTAAVNCLLKHQKSGELNEKDQSEKIGQTTGKAAG